MGDISQKYTDIEGKLAAGGNVNFVGGLGSTLSGNSGNVVVTSLTGNGESHNYLFNGDLPNVSSKYYTPPKHTTHTQVSEPTNLPGLGLVAVVFGLFRYKRNQATCLE
ncbi:MAG: hypothetical protein V7K97_02315 [Nostoc sp.]|uniref:hypothetical protein n=1 Tax=Nostoc sp. TaxID=1180 RepID=UPI002FF65C97